MNEFVQVNPTTACSSSDNQDLSSVSIDFQTRPLAPIGIPENSYYKRWCFSDKLFEGKFKSGNETPSTPHTPAINTEKRLRSIEMSTVKQSFKKRDIGNFEARFIMNKENPGFNTQETPLKMPKMIQEAETSRYDQDYIQESLLGSGNFGSVYKCINKIDGLQYAVKQIKTSARNKILKQEALQEAYTLATSSTCEDNTYVIRYHSVWVEKDYLYIATELCECSLSEYIAKNSITEALIKKIMRDICKGLKKLHANSIVHMDIKADNIFYSFSHKFKLGDLGLARITTNLTGEIPEGDARYLAREVLQHTEEDSDNIPDLSKSDIFSLGATIYEIMRRKTLPMNGSEWHDIRNGDLNFRDDSFTEELKDTIRNMMNQESSLRPTAVELLNTFLCSEKVKEIKRLENCMGVLKRQIAELRTGYFGNKRKLTV